MMKTIAYVTMAAVLFACGNNQAQPETASSPVASAPVALSAAPAASSAAPVASASTVSAPVASGSAAPVADEGVVIQLKGNLIMVNGSVAGALGDTKLEDLSTKLKSSRDLWMKLHAGQTFPGRATIKPEKITSAAAVTHILDVAHNAGYPNAAVITP